MPITEDHQKFLRPQSLQTCFRKTFQFEALALLEETCDLRDKNGDVLVDGGNVHGLFVKISTKVYGGTTHVSHHGQ